METLWGP